MQEGLESVGRTDVSLSSVRGVSSAKNPDAVPWCASHTVRPCIVDACRCSAQSLERVGMSGRCVRHVWQVACRVKHIRHDYVAVIAHGGTGATASRECGSPKAIIPSQTCIDRRTPSPSGKRTFNLLVWIGIRATASYAAVSSAKTVLSFCQPCSLLRSQESIDYDP